MASDASAIAWAAAASSSPPVWSASATTRAGRRGSDTRSWSATSSSRGGIGCPGEPSISVEPTRWQRTSGVRDGAVVEAERHARVRRVHERSLALHEQQLSPAPTPFDHELLGRAREEVGDNGVHRDAPACDRDPGLPGGHEERRQPSRACGAVELERDRHLPDGAVGADGEDDPGVDLEVRARRAVEAGRRPAQVAKLDAGPVGHRTQLGVVGEHLVEPVLDREARGRCTRAGSRARRAGSDLPGSRRRRARPPARTSSPRRGRPRSGAPASSSPARVESRIATTSSRRYRRTPRIVLP